MAFVALGSLRSAGVTTTALALARTWPEERSVLLAEVDPAGGTLAGTLGLRPEPGLQSFAAEARHGIEYRLTTRSGFGEHAQSLGDQAAILLAPPTSEQTRAALAMLGDLPALFRSEYSSPDVLATDLLCDCGRLDVASPVLALFSSADLALLVVRRELSDLHVLWASLGGRGLAPERFGGRLGVLLVGDGPYGAAEVEEAIGAPVLGVVPHDPSGVRALTAESPRPLALRSALPRATRTLAASLVEQLTAEREDAASDEVLVPQEANDLNVEVLR